jgi:Glycosyl hydrolase family 26
MGAKARVGAAVLAAGMLAALQPALTGTGASPAGAAPAPKVWGIGGIKDKAEVQALEAKVGRQFGAVRVFLFWDTPFPTSYYTWLATTGRTPLISLRAKRVNGTLVSWQSIADAAPGSPLYTQVATWADKIKAYGVPVRFTFNHEPEAADSNGNGTQAAYIAAWRKVITIFRDRGVTNAKYLWIMTANAFRVGSGDRRFAIKWYPGDAYLDELGTDIYNDYTCRSDSDSPWFPLTTEIEKFRQFGAARPTKPMWLAEWASTEDPQNAGRKGQWITEVRESLKAPAYDQIIGVLYFHKFRPGTPCTWYVDSTPASLSAFSAMGADPVYSGRIASG